MCRLNIIVIKLNKNIIGLYNYHIFLGFGHIVHLFLISLLIFSLVYGLQ